VEEIICYNHIKWKLTMYIQIVFLSSKQDLVLKVHSNTSWSKLTAKPRCQSSEQNIGVKVHIQSKLLEN